MKANNMWITGAIVSAGGQFFREVASNWFIEDYKDITYPRILGMGARYFGGFQPFSLILIFSVLSIFQNSGFLIISTETINLIF